MTVRLYIPLALNPEPWAIGPLGIGRKGGKSYPYIGPNDQLEAYQNAVKEELSHVEMLDMEFLSLEFYFWRRLDQYRGPSGKLVTKRAADTTNLQKGLEDALQGILFKNDRNNLRVSSEVMSQSKDTLPYIMVVASEYSPTEWVHEWAPTKEKLTQITMHQDHPFEDTF